MGGGAIKKYNDESRGILFFFPSDIVLAERGFDIDIFELVGMLVTDVKSLL